MSDKPTITRPLRILHLEDDPADAELIRHELAADSRPVEVVCVAGRAAFEAALRAGGFHLVLSDYSVPGFEGPQALALAQAVAPEVPFIIISGALDEDTAVSLVRNGATDYVFKNRLRRLGPAVHQALREARERQARREAERQLGLQVDRLALLAEAAHSFGEAGPDYHSVLNAVVRRVAGLLGDRCTVRLLSEDERSLPVAADWHRNPDTLEFLRGSAAQPMSVDEAGVCGRVVRTGHSVLLPALALADVRAHLHAGQWPYWERFGAHSLVAVPLWSRGRVIGVMVATRDETPAPYSLDDQHLLRGLADRAALAIENARLYEAAQSAWGAAEVAAERTAKLMRVTAQLAAALTPDQVGNIIVNEGAAVLGPSAATLQLLSPEGDRLFVVNASRTHPAIKEQRKPLAMSDATPSADVVRTGQAVWLPSQVETLRLYPRMAETRLVTGYEALAVLPMTVESRPIGTLAINFPQERTFSAEEQAFMLTLAGLCAQALERARLYAAEAAARSNAERAVARTERLQAVTAALATVVSPAEVARVVVAQSVAAMGAQGGSVSVLDPDGQWLERLESVGYGDAVRDYVRLPLNAAVPTADCVRRREPIWVKSHAAFRDLYPQWASASRAFNFEAMAVVPLLSDHEAVGALAVTFASPRAFGPEDRDFLMAVAQQCAQALERARLFDAERRSRHAAELSAARTARLQMVAAALAQALTPQQVTAVVVEHGVAALGAAAGSIALRDPERPVITVVQAPGYSTEVLAQFGEIPLEAPLPAAESARTGRAIWVESAAELSERYPAVAEVHAGLGHGAVAAVPIAVAGQVAGTLALSFAGPRGFDAEEKALILALTQQCAQALERARLYAEAQALNSALEARVRERTEQLRALTDRLETLREEERARIAREVHDELGGAMTAMKMDLSRLTRRAAQYGPELPEAMASTIALIDDTIRTVRRIASDLRPALLDDFGLLAAVEWQAQEFTRRTGIECELAFEVPQVDLDRQAATALFRVIQESLTNVARHSGATRVTISLAERPGCLVLTLGDNGQGFAVEESERGPTLGLAGMRERVFSIAGDLAISSTPGQGTTVEVTVPLEAPAEVTPP